MKIVSLACLILLSACAKEKSAELQVEALGVQEAKDLGFNQEQLKAIDENAAKNHRMMLELSSPEDQKILLQQEKQKKAAE